jgi:FeS assembly SUF system protein
MHTDAHRSETDRKQPSLICVHLWFKLFVAPWLRFGPERYPAIFGLGFERRSTPPARPSGPPLNGLGHLDGKPMSDDYKHPSSLASLPVLPAHPRPDPPPAPAAAPDPDPSLLTPELRRKLLEGKIIAAISKVYDPEIPVNVYELGLIYDIAIADDNTVKVKMTLTAPGCPVAGSLPAEVGKQVESVPEVTDCEVELVWEPSWTKDRMSEAALLTLGM